MNKRNEFENFCDELSEGQVNKVDYVRKQLKAKYQNNTDMYLMIKAEAQEDDHMQYITVLIAIITLVITSLDVIHNFVPNTGILWIDLLVNMIYLLLIIMFLKIATKDKFPAVRKWRKYILIVIDDLIEESRKSTVIEVTSMTDKKNKANMANEQDETGSCREFAIEVYEK